MSPLCRQLAEVVRERYLSGPEKAMRHGILADFFLGAWSQGTKKLITLPLVGKPLNLDRKVRCLHPCSPPPSTSTRLCGQDQVTIHTFPSSLSSFMPRSWASLADVLPPRFFVLFLPLKHLKAQLKCLFLQEAFQVFLPSQLLGLYFVFPSLRGRTYTFLKSLFKMIFGIILDLQRSCKLNTQTSPGLFCQFPPTLTFSITVAH